MAAVFTPKGEQDWQKNKTLSQSMIYMLQNKILSDVTFYMKYADEKEQNISAHKFVLMSRSPVFYTMFNTVEELREKGDVVITDIPSDAMLEFLR